MHRAEFSAKEWRNAAEIRAGNILERVETSSRKESMMVAHEHYPTSGTQVALEMVIKCIFTQFCN